MQISFDEIQKLPTEDINSIVKSLIESNDIENIIICFEELSRREPTNINYRYYQAHYVQLRPNTAEDIRRAECQEKLLKILEDFPYLKENPRKQHAAIYMRLAETYLYLGPRKKGYWYFKIVAELTGEADVYAHMAEHYFIDNNIPEWHKNLSMAMKLKPEKFNTKANIDLMNSVQKDTFRFKRKYYRFPKLEKFRGKLEDLIREELAVHLRDEKFIRKNTKFFTMGSCFAENISRTLVELGFNSTHMPLTEAINTTFSNKYFVDWLNNISVDAEFNKSIEETLPENWGRDRIISEIKAAEVFIMTLGVATGFFDSETQLMTMPRPKQIHEISLSKRFTPRMTTVSENIKNVLHVINYVVSSTKCNAV